MVGSTSNELLSLTQTLSASLDPNAQIRESATTQLQSLAKTWPGFYPSLIELVGNKSFDLGTTAQEIRLQAILQFKNGVERYWRKGSGSAISSEIKAGLRPRLLEMVTEQNQLVRKESPSFPTRILIIPFPLVGEEYSTLHWQDCTTRLRYRLVSRVSIVQLSTSELNLVLISGKHFHQHCSALCSLATIITRKANRRLFSIAHSCTSMRRSKRSRQTE